ncbi:hypothetical protein Dimus_031585, partial [Dionaea muscipula]
KQKWENLFKGRRLMHTAACKEFYANLTVFIYKKKEIAKSRVKGVEIEFDSMKLASILDVPGHTGIIKDHELPYGDWMTMVFKAFGVPLVDKKGEEPKRRRDDDAPEEEAEKEEENQTNFDWEAVVDEAAVEGESGSGEKFYDAEDEAQGSPEVNEEIPAAVTHASAQQKEKESSGVDPSCPTGRIPEAVMTKFQAEFERARANRFQA